MGSEPIYIFRDHLQSEDTLENKCILCEDTNADTVRTFFVNATKFEIRKCSADGLMYVSPMPGPEFLRSLYSDAYFSRKDELVGGSDFHDDVTQQERAAIRAKEIEVFHGYTRVHELGFGTGYLLQELQSKGYVVSGNDISEVAVQSARRKGVENVVQGDLTHAREVGVVTNVDVLLLYDLIEHVPNPLLELELSYEILNPNGLAFIRYPFIPDEGPSVNLVDHLWHFNRDTMAQLLRTVGFEVVEQFDSGKFVGEHATVQGVTAIARKSRD